MKKIRVILFGCFLLLTACCSTKNVTYGDGGLTRITDKGYITVVGVATDQLRRTAIEDDKGVYYVMKDIRGGWPQGVEGKKVKAYGKCLIIDRRKFMEKTNYLTGGPAITYVLTDAKWELIE